jgi:hypothetical protein
VALVRVEAAQRRVQSFFERASVRVCVRERSLELGSGAGRATDGAAAARCAAAVVAQRVCGVAVVCAAHALRNELHDAWLLVARQETVALSNDLFGPQHVLSFGALLSKFTSMANCLSTRRASLLAPCRAIPVPNATRWDSMAACLHVSYEQREAMDRLTGMPASCKPTQDDWDSVREILPILALGRRAWKALPFQHVLIPLGSAEIVVRALIGQIHSHVRSLPRGSLAQQAAFRLLLGLMQAREQLFASHVAKAAAAELALFLSRVESRLPVTAADAARVAQLLIEHVVPRLEKCQCCLVLHRTVRSHHLDQTDIDSVTRAIACGPVSSGGVGVVGGGVAAAASASAAAAAADPPAIATTLPDLFSDVQLREGSMTCALTLVLMGICDTHAGAPNAKVLDLIPKQSLRSDIIQLLHVISASTARTEGGFSVARHTLPYCVTHGRDDTLQAKVLVRANRRHLLHSAVVGSPELSLGWAQLAIQGADDDAPATTGQGQQELAAAAAASGDKGPRSPAPCAQPATAQAAQLPMVEVADCPVGVQAAPPLSVSHRHAAALKPAAAAAAAVQQPTPAPPLPKPRQGRTALAFSPLPPQSSASGQLSLAAAAKSAPGPAPPLLLQSQHVSEARSTLGLVGPSTERTPERAWTMRKRRR